MPLSQVERQACYYMFSEPAVICQNMFLATEALGIGGWMHCGFLSRDVFKALGFTTVIPRDQPVLANPVGLDGIFRLIVRPIFRTWMQQSKRSSHLCCGKVQAR
jgi:nitroreductase